MPVALGLLPVRAPVASIGEGLNVYLFLTRKMPLGEIARVHSLFDPVAAKAVNGSVRSNIPLLPLEFAGGVVVTTFFTNDATAVVPTGGRKVKTAPRRRRSPSP